MNQPTFSGGRVSNISGQFYLSRGTWKPSLTSRLPPSQCILRKTDSDFKINSILLKNMRTPLLPWTIRIFGPLESIAYALLGTRKNSTLFFSTACALLAKNHPGGGVPRPTKLLNNATEDGNSCLQQAQRIHIHQQRRIGDFFRLAIRQRAAEQFRQYRALRRLQKELEPVLFF